MVEQLGGVAIKRHTNAVVSGVHSQLSECTGTETTAEDQKTNRTVEAQ